MSRFVFTRIYFYSIAPTAVINPFHVKIRFIEEIDANGENLYVINANGLRNCSRI